MPELRRNTRWDSNAPLRRPVAICGATRWNSASFSRSRRRRKFPLSSRAAVFFSCGSKVRYSGRVERVLALEEVALLAAAAAASNQQHPDGGGGGEGHPDADGTSSSSGRRAEDAIDRRFSFDRHRSTECNTPNGSRRSRNHDDSLPRQRHHPHDQDVGPEGHDSYEASSCGSGASQDDRSDVASWVALDLRGLPRHHLKHQQQLHHHNSSINGYDTLTIDSDFYGYAGSTTGSTAADPSNNSWSLHPSDTQDPHHWKRRRKAEIKIRLQL